MTASTANLWSVAGLVYALAGAALLALSVFATPQPAYNSPSRNVRHSLEQWLDARIGTALIAVGFFLQMTGAVGTATLNTPAIFVLLGLALAAGYYALSKDLIVERLAEVGRQGAVVHEPAVVERVEPINPIVLVAVPEAEITVEQAEQVVVDLRRESKG